MKIKFDAIISKLREKDEWWDKGDPGVGITLIEDNGDGTLTLTYWDWSATVVTSDLSGNDWREVELQKGTTHIQRRYVWEATWTDLIAISELQWEPGTPWDDGNWISSIELISTVGKVKTYRITFTDATTFDFIVTDGADGTGIGYMMASVYDPTNKNQDIFAYADGKIAKATNVTSIRDAGISDGDIAVFNLTNKDIRTSSQKIVTTLGSNDSTIPTSKAVKDVTDIKLNLDQTTPQTISNGQPIHATLTASQLVSTDANKKLQSLPVATYPSLAELAYVKGTTSSIQTQLGNKSPIDSPVFTTKIQTPTIELGHATDTTLSRVSAGVIAVEGVNVMTVGSTDTVTGLKTFDKLNRTVNSLTVASNAITVPITYNSHKITNNAAGAVTITLTTTSAVDWQLQFIRFFDFSAVAQTITWVNTENSDVTPFATSRGSTTIPKSALFCYNSATSKWSCLASV